MPVRIHVTVVAVVLAALGLIIVADHPEPARAVAEGAGVSLPPSPAEGGDLTPIFRWLDGVHTAETKAYLNGMQAQRLQAARQRAAATKRRQSTVKAAAAPVQAVTGGGGPLPAILWRIARCEGYPTYVHADHGPESSASGKFGFLDGTWRSWRGSEGAQYARAMDAPESVQDAAAIRLYNADGTTPWNASKGCWG